MKELNVRRGGESDLTALQRLLESHQMKTEVDPAEFWLAEVEGGLAGAARLEWEDGLAYLRPVAVDPEWQAQGIGRRLIQELAEGLPELNVVARGEAVGFYTRLGFMPAAWEQVPERYRQECADCPDSESCQPQPMAWERGQKGI
jgi:N-acetylglutamate synthase-like GNAT family acetyltransferase